MQKKFTFIILVLLVTTAVVVSGCVKKPAAVATPNSSIATSTSTITASLQDEIVSLVLKNRSSEEFIVKIGKSNGYYAIGSINAVDGGGAVWIAKLVGNDWKIIFEGQEYPSCKVLKDNSVPTEIYNGNCY